MEKNKKKQLENESHSRVNEPLEGAVAYSSGVAHAEEPLYDFNGKDFGLPTTLEEVEKPTNIS